MQGFCRNELILKVLTPLHATSQLIHLTLVYRLQHSFSRVHRLHQAYVVLMTVAYRRSASLPIAVQTQSLVPAHGGFYALRRRALLQAQ